jgi:hypothetical protein
MKSKKHNKTKKRVNNTKKNKQNNKNKKNKQNKLSIFNIFNGLKNWWTGYKNPDPIQIFYLLNIPPKTAFYIINFIKFDNKKVYYEYAKWAEKLMKPYGIHRVTDIHSVKFTLIGNPHHEFDEMFIVKYPNIDAAKRYGAETENDAKMLAKRKQGIKYCKLFVSYPAKSKF